MIITKYVTRYGKPFPVSSLSSSSNIRVDVECSMCKQQRSVMYASVARSGHTDCQKCKVSAANEKPLDEGAKFHMLTVLGRDKAGYTLFICDCGESKVINNWRVTSGNTKSCGCLRKGNRFHAPISGKSHPNWKGGISGDRERFMQEAVYKAWRLDVFERDSYTCDKCEQVGGKLEAHHLAPYHSHPELRVDIDNGVTLCQTCHAAFHAKYGRLDCTPSDYRTFKT